MCVLVQGGYEYSQNIIFHSYIQYYKNIYDAWDETHPQAQRVGVDVRSIGQYDGLNSLEHERCFHSPFRRAAHVGSTEGFKV